MQTGLRVMSYLQRSLIKQLEPLSPSTSQCSKLNLLQLSLVLSPYRTFSMAELDDIKLSLASFYQLSLKARDAGVVEDEFEVVKETGIQLVQHLGVWASTKPLADLSTAVIAAKVIAELGPKADVKPICHASLGAAVEMKNIGYLSTLEPKVLERIGFMARLANQHIRCWLWSDEVIGVDILYNLCYQASMVLEDVIYVSGADPM